MTNEEFKIPDAPTPCLIHVTNISKNITPLKLKEFFEFCGNLTNLQLREASDESQEALLLFSNPVSANTATMLTNARLDDRVITAKYFFAEYQHIPVPLDQQPEQQQTAVNANKMVSQWLAQGLLLTDQLIANGKTMLERYGLMQKLDMIAKVTQDKVEEYKIKERVAEVDQRYQISQLVQNYFNAASVVYEQAKSKHPIIQQADDLVKKTVQTVDATISESKKIYGEQKSQTE